MSSRATTDAPAGASGSAADVAIPQAVGSIARISGLKSAPALNGQLCHVLRVADTSERVVVRTRLGEKSLKHANLQGGRAVYPAGAGSVAGVLLMISFLAMADVLWSGGRRAPSAAAIPILMVAWLVATLGLCLWLHWPCRNPDTWLISISQLSMKPPICHMYRLGLMTAGLLLTIHIWLYDGLLMEHLSPVPPSLLQGSPPPLLHGTAQAPPAPPAPAPPVVDETAESPEDVGGAGGAAQSATVVGAASGSAAQNATDQNQSYMIWGPDRSVKWGYAAAAGMGVAGACTFDARLSLRSLGHVLGMGLFVGGSMQFSLLSSQLLWSPRGEPIRSASATLQSVMRLRRNVTDYGPIVLVGLPLSTSTLFTRRPLQMPADGVQRPMISNVIKESGVDKLLGIMQWALLLMYTLLYSTFACDYWVASHLG